jgi:hypothetical protein
MAGSPSSYDNKRTGILQTTGSFKSIQWTDNDRTSESNRFEILDSSRNLKNINNADIDGTLTADGLASMNAGLSASSVAVADLSNGRVVFAGVAGELKDDASLTYDGSDLTIDGSTFGASVVISGDLTVQGSTTTVSSTEVTIADAAIQVASTGSNSDIQAIGGAGIHAGSGNLASFLYDGSDSWDSTENMNIASGKSFNIDDDNMLDADGAAKVRSAVAGDGLGHSTGVLAVNVDDSSIEIDSDSLQVKALGVTNAMLAGNIASTKIAELSNFDTADLAEGSNLYYLDSRARAAISGTDNGGDGSFSYNQSTGEISYTGPSSSEVRAHFSNGNMLDYSAGQFSVNASAFSASWDEAMAADNTDSLAEGSTNQYYLDSRARGAVSVTDNGGDGSLSYDSGSGVISYTGPSAAEVRAHFSGAAGIALSSGDISVNVDDAGIEIDSDTLRLKSSAMAGTDEEVEVSYSGGQFTIGLPDDVTVSASFTAANGQFDTDLNVGLGILTVEDGNFSVGTVADFSDTFNAQGAASFEDNVTITGSLAFDAGASVDRILDEDGMGSNSATALATQQSIKAYVDAQLTAQDLDMSSDSGSGSVDLDSETLTIAGTSNEIETSFSGQTLTIGLPSDVTIGQDLTVTRNFVANGNVDLGDAAGDTISANGSFDTNLMPSTNGTLDMGDDDNRWGDIYATNMYTGDLHMKNERGDWTLFEESDHIRIRNNATGQEFKLNMTPVEE